MKKLGIGFVGAGWMGATLLRRLTEREDTKIIGLHQRSRENALTVLEELRLSAELFMPSYEEMLANPAVEAVFLCSTNAAHGPQAIAALRAGKHIFCEKPCATVFDEFTRQIELSRERPDLITFVDYLMNFDTMEHRIVDFTRAGSFGEITQIQVNYRHPVNITGDKVWKLKKETIGDAIGQGIIHSISAMVGIMGAAKAEATSVFATKGEVQNRGFEVPPVYNLVISFSNGATGLCLGNIDHANGYDAYHNVHGTQGGFIFDSYLDRPNKIRFWSNQLTEGKWIYPLDRERCRAAGVESLAWPDDTTTPDSGDVVKHQTGKCVSHFLDCVASGQQSPWSFANSASTAEIGWAALMSAELGQAIKLPLDWATAKEFFQNWP